MLAINLESVGVIDFKMGSSEHIGGDDRMKLHKASHDRKVEVVVHVFEKPTGTQNKRKIVTDKSPTLECLMANISIKDGPPSSNKEKGKSFTFPALPSTMSKTKNCCQDVRTDIMTQNEGDEPENEEYTDEKNDYGSDSDEVLQERGPMYGSGRSQKYHPYDTKSNSPSSHSDSSQSSSPESSPRREPNTTHMANRLSGGSYVVCSGSQQNIRPASRAIDIEKSSALSRSSGGGIVQSAGPYLEPNVTGTLDILPQNFGSSPNRISQTSLDITPVSFMTVQEHPDYSPSVSSPASSTTDDFGVLSPFPYSPEIAPDIKKTLSDESFIEKFPEVRISPDSPDLSVFELCNPVTIGLTSFGKSLSGHLAESNPELEADVLQPSLLDEGIDGGSNKSPVVDDLGGMMEKYGVTHDDVAAKDSITFSLQDDIGSKPAQFLPQKDISTKSKPYSDHPVYNPSVGKGPTYFVTEAVGQLGTKSIPSSSVSFLPLLTRTQKLRLILPKPTNSTSPDLDGGY